MKLRNYFASVFTIGSFFFMPSMAHGQVGQNRLKHRREPIYAIKKVKIGEKKVPVYRTVKVAPVVVTARVLIGLVTFTDDVLGKNAGLSAATELAHYFVSERDSINHALKAGPGMCNSSPDCLKIIQFSKLPELSRIPLPAEPKRLSEEETPLPSEQELEKLSSKERRRIREEIARREENQRKEERRYEEQKKMYLQKMAEARPNVDYYITGHVLKADEADWVVLLSVLDAETHSVVVSQRIAAKTAKAFAHEAGRRFLPHERTEVIGEKTEDVFTTRKEISGYKNIPENSFGASDERKGPQMFLTSGFGVMGRPDFLTATLDAGLGLQWDRDFSHSLQVMVLGGMGVGNGGGIYAKYGIETRAPKLNYHAGIGAGIGQFAYEKDDCIPADGAVSPQCYRYFLPLGMVTAGANYKMDQWSFGPELQVFFGYGDEYNSSQESDKYYYSFRFLFQVKYQF